MSRCRDDFEQVMAELGELARYQVCGEERVLVLYPVSAGAVVLDVPAAGEGRCYAVAGGCGDGAALAGLATEYVRHAHAVGCPPMSRRAVEAIVGVTESGLAGAIAGRAS